MRRADEVESLLPLTSLRFVAAMMIVVHHIKLYFPWSWSVKAPSSLVHGVSFFFVLSGFILTHVYTSKPFPGYGRFMRARFARLWPVHVFALLVLVIFVRPDSISFDGPGIFSKWVVLAANLTLTHSFVPFIAYAFSWNGVSWSISTEMFFYLMFPLLLINIRRTWYLKLAGAAAVVALIIVGVTAMHLPADGGVQDLTVSSMLYTNPIARLFEFCLGMSTWVLWDRYIKPLKIGMLEWTAIELALCAALVGWLGWGFYAVAQHISNAALLSEFGEAGSCWLFAVLIAVMASGRGVLARVLSLPFFVFLGEISFSIYMLHQILLKFFGGWMPAGVTTPTMYFAAMFFCAAGSFVMVEKPMQRLLTGKRRPAVSLARTPRGDLPVNRDRAARENGDAGRVYGRSGR
ncbi:lipopolysaccharide biosynthesis-related membrane protein [Caballeronia peredens]|nr:lipopolysaccharide biosynthesis-related membrane protein [Caballeronia peredens]